MRTACLIAARRYQAGDGLAVYCRLPGRLDAFDRLLWEYERAAFVPHVRADDPLAGETPILLYGAPPAEGHAWVLNLDDECVPDAGRYAHVVEVVSSEERERQAGRARWRAYQAAGHTIVQHDVARDDLP